jgi:3-dehydroquinate dehydratase II
MTIQIINGPNLNLIGKRETQIYGTASLQSYLEQLQQEYSKHQIQLFQSNVEGEIINHLHHTMDTTDAYILNCGGYSHTSIAIADAIKAVMLPCVEVHISNIYAREEMRHHSITGANCVGVISGLGLYGYKTAIDFIINKYQ